MSSHAACSQSYPHIHCRSFDYDYTLVCYTNALQSLIYDKALQRMVDSHGYPRHMGRQLMGGYDPKFAVSGRTASALTLKLIPVSNVTFPIPPNIVIQET